MHVHTGPARGRTVSATQSQRGRWAAMPYGVSWSGMLPTPLGRPQSHVCPGRKEGAPCRTGAGAQAWDGLRGSLRHPPAPAPGAKPAGPAHTTLTSHVTAQDAESRSVLSFVPRLPMQPSVPLVWSRPSHLSLLQLRSVSQGTLSCPTWR